MSNGTSVYWGTGVSNAIKALDASFTGATSKTLTALTQTDGKITTATFSNIAIDASQVTSGTLPTARGGTGNTSYTAQRLIYASSASKLASTPYMHLNYSAGTTSAVGYEELVIGNNINQGTANNCYGRFAIYSANTAGSYITAASSTSWITHVLPATTGWLATGGNGTSTGAGDATHPVYLSTAGVLTQCSGTLAYSISGSAAKLGTSTIGSARQAIYLNAGVATAGNYTVAHLGNASKSNMNDVGRLHASMGMTQLADPSNTTDNPGNSTGWHHYIDINFSDDPNGSNSWVTQFANKAGTTDLWMRSRNGGTIANGTAWSAPWTRVLTETNTGKALIKQSANAVLGVDGSTLKIGTARKDLNFDIANGSGSGVNDGYAGGITWGLDTAAYAGIYYQTSSSYGSRLILATTSSYANGSYARMIVHSNGNVGIGTLSPDTLLTVAGAGKFTSTVTLGADPTANMHAATKQYVDGKITALDVVAITGTAAQTITSISEADGKISATYSNISLPWSQLTGIPITFITNSGSLASGGWATLGGTTSGSKIAISYNNNAAAWNSGTYSASLVFGCADTKGLLDLSHNTPIVTFGGSSNGGATANNPKWYFKLSGTSGQTYTFPSTSKTLAAADGSNASGTWDINAATATADPNEHNFVDTYAKEYLQVIDLTSDDITKWYPVTIVLPQRGLRRVSCVTQLNSGHKPSWASHSSGYTAVVEMLVTAAGWGTTNALSICLTNNQLHLNANEPKPIGFSQFNNSSRATFWCRGGAKYRLLTDFFGTWTVYRTNTTVSSQTIGPKTANPDIVFSKSTIVSNLDGNAVTATTATKLTDFVVSTHTIPAGKGVRIQYPEYEPVLISAQRTNGQARLILIGGGYGAEGAVRNDFTEVVSSSTSNFTWSLPASASISHSIEIMNVKTSGTANVTVWTSAACTFTEITALTSTATNRTLLHSANTYVASSSAISVGWNTETTIATINGTAVKIKIPANPNTNTDTLVKQTAKTDSIEYKLLATSSASPTSGNAAEAIYSTDIAINPSSHILTITRANHDGDAGIIVNNTHTTNPLKLGYIIGGSGNGGIYDYTHGAWKVQIAANGTATFNGNASTASNATTLATGRTLQVALGSTSASTEFNGSANVHDIGVSGTLAIAHGGTGATTAANALTNLGALGNVTASGTAPLTLSASKSGTTVAISGSVAAASYTASGIVNTDTSQPQDFKGTKTFSGLRNSNMETFYANGGIQIREQNHVEATTSNTDMSYAPHLGFHWAGRTAGTIYLNASGQFNFLNISATGADVLTGRTFNAVWNDYAEFRKGLTSEPGRVVTESKEGMKLAQERLMSGCKIISDTYGTSMGETDDCKTPIAVAGRVLVYPYRNREEYQLGAAVCSAPNGTVDIMTREEIMMYPDRIVGTVSEIPDYETWGEKSVEVNDRIWVYVR